MSEQVIEKYGINFEERAKQILSTEPILAAKDLEVQFTLRGEKLNAIRKCSLELYDGETLAIVGESGSGKSVFTKCFVGMLDKNGSITGGSILYNGQDLTKFTTEKEWRTIRGMMKNPKADIAVLFTTLLLTVVFDLTIAIAAGLLMAVVLFMRRIMESTNISVIHDQIDMTADAESNHRDDKVEVAEGVEVYEIDGPFFFGIASKFDDVMHTMGEKSKVRIIRMRKVPFIDSTGLHNLSNLIRASRKEGIEVILSGVNPSVRETLLKAGIDRLEQFLIEGDAFGSRSEK